ncbi:hypothetical protein DEA8626_00547 [Defluviimonas aquaemixtae]|uniref:Uncharacterized protein n=1 Tax=Albidovulum aquaemixtae TaxID=1542388 RepID=A0A2R8B3H8_9RHOB|nr:hypothetical protein [Defluviimonas aquaemixtae]SPH17033.1 hypothetical protein DEA8626_00547 [Defluviimonas aquaemixtae]
MVETDKDYSSGLSRQGREISIGLAKASIELQAAFDAHPEDVKTALYNAPNFAATLDAIDSMGSVAAAEGAGPDVPAEDAGRNGELLLIDPDGKCFTSTLSAAVHDHVANGVGFVVAGAGSSLAALVEELPAWRGHLGLNGLVVQYVGIDQQHWSPDKAIRILEVNLLQAAAIQVLNSAMNKAGRPCAVISIGFGCWVANCALQLLPLRRVWYARNLQIDALGSQEVLGDLMSAKKGGFGSICHVQGNGAKAALSGKFGLSEKALGALPVDIRA